MEDRGRVFDYHCTVRNHTVGNLTDGRTMGTKPEVKQSCSTCEHQGDPCESYNRGYKCHRWISDALNRVIKTITAALEDDQTVQREYREA